MELREERGKVHLNLQAEEAWVLLDSNWIVEMIRRIFDQDIWL